MLTIELRPQAVEQEIQVPSFDVINRFKSVVSYCHEPCYDLSLLHVQMKNVGLSIYGRLGNNVMQLLDAIYYCNTGECKKIVYNLGGGTVNHEALGDIGSILPFPFECRLPSGTEILFTNEACAKPLPFNASEQYSFGPGSSLPRAVDAFSIKDSPLRLKSFNKDIKYFGRLFLKACLQKSSTFNDAPFQSDDVALVHLRGEDVFRKYFNHQRAVHPGYPQPPLSYYKGVVKRLVRKKGINRIILMPQDCMNPVFVPLWESLKSMGNEASVELLSVGLLDTVILLLSCTYLISSRGTFVPSFGSLSSRLKAIVSFRDFANFDTVLSARKIKTILIKDQAASYTPVGTWNSSEEQIKLMLSYPMSSLDFGKNWKK